MASSTQRHWQYNIFLNQPKSKYSETPDTELSRKFANMLKDKAKRWGFVRCFDPDINALPKDHFNTLFDLIEHSEYTLVILTRKFNENKWVRYCVDATVKKRTDDISRAFNNVIGILVGVDHSALPSSLILNDYVSFTEDEREWQEDTNSWMKLRTMMGGESPNTDSIEELETDCTEAKVSSLFPGVACRTEPPSGSSVFTSVDKDVEVIYDRREISDSKRLLTSESDSATDKEEISRRRNRDLLFDHGLMINELSGKIAKVPEGNVRDYWDSFIHLISVYMEDAQRYKCNSIRDVCEILMNNKKIQLGKYGILIEVFRNIKHETCCEIVEKYTNIINEKQRQHQSAKELKVSDKMASRENYNGSQERVREDQSNREPTQSQNGHTQENENTIASQTTTQEHDRTGQDYDTEPIETALQKVSQYLSWRGIWRQFYYALQNI